MPVPRHGGRVCAGCARCGILCDAIPCSNWTEVEVYGGIAAFALLYLVVGLCCSRWALNRMSVFYWSALALSCGALLFYVRA